MKSIVCVKRVPDSETKVKIDDSGKAINTADVKFVINPYDEFALEQAVSLKEAGEGEVMVVTMTNASDAQKQVREALAVGADRALMLEDSAGMRDPLTVAEAIVKAIKDSGFEFDAVFMGKQAIDSDENAVGPMVATLLDIPCVSDISTFDHADGKATVRRGIEGAEELVEVPLPAVFTCDKGLNEPRYASLKGIMKAKKKPLDKVEAGAGESKLEVVKLAPPPPRPEGKIVGEGVEAIPELVRLLHDEAKKI